MRILQVITDTDRRGAQVFAVDLQEALVTRGHQVTTVALCPGGNAEQLDVPVLGRTRLGLATLRALRQRFHGVDVVAAHGSSTLPACGIAGLGSATPLVYRQISDSLFWAPTRRRRLRVRTWLSLAARVVALSTRSATVLEERFGVPPDKIDVVPNGVARRDHVPATGRERQAARAELGLPDTDGIVAVLSALVPEKGVDIAIDVVAGLPAARLVIAGDGPERARLEQLADTRAPGRVDFLGSLPDPGPVYRAADVVLLPSRGGDSMPAVLIEAGFRALPAVATDVGAVRDVVVDGETGFVLPDADSAGLTAAVGQVLAEPQRAKELGGRAQEWCIGQFEIGVVAEGWEKALAAARADSSGG